MTSFTKLNKIGSKPPTAKVPEMASSGEVKVCIHNYISVNRKLNNTIWYGFTFNLFTEGKDSS